MTKKILFLQNGPEKYSNSRVDLRFEGAGFAVDYYWAYQGEFPTRVDDYGGVYLSGSPHSAYEDLAWIHEEHRLIRRLATERIPILGICFGSQILASALCGKDQVFRRPFCEVGYKWIELCHPAEGDPLLYGLGQRVYMFVWHNDEIRHDHPQMRILGFTDMCPNQIWRFQDLPIWGIQGHPELTLSQARMLFEERRAQFEQDGADINRLLKEADEALEAKRLITNFMRVCAGDAQRGIKTHQRR